MGYNTRNYWVFGLHSSSGIVKNIKEYSASETVSVSVLKCGGRHVWGRKQIQFSNVVFFNVFFLEYRTADAVQKPNNLEQSLTVYWLDSYDTECIYTARTFHVELPIRDAESQRVYLEGLCTPGQAHFSTNSAASYSSESIVSLIHCCSFVGPLVIPSVA
jgi:hypothetical protein